MKSRISPSLSTFAAALPGLVLCATAPALLAGWQDFQSADLILGRRKLPTPTALYLPSDVAINAASGKVYVVDQPNHRVLRFSSAAALGNGQAAEAAFGQQDLFSAEYGPPAQASLLSPSHAAVDSAGSLWVTDADNHRVLRWANADSLASGQPAVQVLGQPDFTTGDPGTTQTALDNPRGITVDSTGRLWVADQDNNRILRFDNAATKGNGGSANGVIGQPGYTAKDSGITQTTLDNPADVAVDSTGRLWVADSFNHRVLRFDNPTSQNQPPASGVLGQPGFTTRTLGADATQIGFPTSLSISTSGALFVLEYANSRISRWDNAAAKPNGGAGDGVLGRSGFGAAALYSGAGGGVSGQNGGISVDTSGRLWLADIGYERVLRWDGAAAKANGANADGVIGEANILSYNLGNYDPATQPLNPYDGLEDPATGKFFLADSGRVLRYKNRATAEAGAAPEAYLGKTSSTEYGESSPGDKILRSSRGLALDAAGRLWVSDPAANRVVAYPDAATAPTGSAATIALGQPSLFTGSPGLAQDKMNSPWGLAIDASGALYVADYYNHRILRFNNVASLATGAPASAVIGQQDFVTATTSGNNALLHEPAGLRIDAAGRLWVADCKHHRVLRYDSPLTAVPLQAPSGQLGSIAVISPVGLIEPTAIAITAAGRLWVSDTGSNRIVRFDNAAAKPDGASADGVLGVSTLSTNTYYAGRTLRTFSRPNGLFLDARENLWVSDQRNARVLRFSPKMTATVIAHGLDLQKRFFLTFQALESRAYVIRSSTDLKTWVLEDSAKMAAGGTRTFTDTKTGPARFFRVDEQ